MKYPNELERRYARVETWRRAKQKRAELKRLLESTKPICRKPYCLGEALESGYCGRHEEEMEMAA